jgi:ABC-type antimicrobial peptide transport system permease subunit
LASSAAVDHQVRRRRRDIAIRLALGASAHGVVGHLVGDGVRLASAGAAVGVVAAAGTSGAFAALLYGVAPGDPFTLALVAAAVVGAAVVAAWLPARAAARVDPLEILGS